MMINILHLLWIVPISTFAGILTTSLAVAASANDEEKCCRNQCKHLYHCLSEEGEVKDETH